MCVRVGDGVEVGGRGAGGPFPTPISTRGRRAPATAVRSEHRCITAQYRPVLYPVSTPAEPTAEPKLRMRCYNARSTTTDRRRRVCVSDVAVSDGTARSTHSVRCAPCPWSSLSAPCPGVAAHVPAIRSAARTKPICPARCVRWIAAHPPCTHVVAACDILTSHPEGSAWGR